MKLYYSPGACSLSPHIALREAGLTFELQRVDLKTKRIAGGGDYTEVNPKGYVPALRLDDGQLLTEGPAIVQWIADQKPDAGLAPPNGTIERVRLQEALNFISTEIHKSFSPLFRPDAAPAWKEAAKENLVRRFDLLSKQLDGREYLLGSRFTVADGYLFTTLNWTNFLSFDLGRWPALQAYLARVGSRPKVREALQAEGLTK